MAVVNSLDDLTKGFKSLGKAAGHADALMETIIKGIDSQALFDAIKANKFEDWLAAAKHGAEGDTLRFLESAPFARTFKSMANMEAFDNAFQKALLSGEKIDLNALRDANGIKGGSRLYKAAQETLDAREAEIAARAQRIAQGAGKDATDEEILKQARGEWAALNKAADDAAKAAKEPEAAKAAGDGASNPVKPAGGLREYFKPLSVERAYEKIESIREKHLAALFDPKKRGATLERDFMDTSSSLEKLADDLKHGHITKEEARTQLASIQEAHASTISKAGKELGNMRSELSAMSDRLATQKSIPNIINRTPIYGAFTNAIWARSILPVNYLNPGFYLRNIIPEALQAHQITALKKMSDHSLRLLDGVETKLGQANTAFVDSSKDIERMLSGNAAPSDISVALNNTSQSLKRSGSEAIEAGKSYLKDVREPAGHSTRYKHNEDSQHRLRSIIQGLYSDEKQTIPIIKGQETANPERNAMRLEAFWDTKAAAGKAPHVDDARDVAKLLFRLYEQGEGHAGIKAARRMILKGGRDGGVSKWGVSQGAIIPKDTIKHIQELYEDAAKIAASNGEAGPSGKIATGKFTDDKHFMDYLDSLKRMISREDEGHSPERWGMRDGKAKRMWLSQFYEDAFEWTQGNAMSPVIYDEYFITPMQNVALGLKKDADGKLHYSWRTAVNPLTGGGLSGAKVSAVAGLGVMGAGFVGSKLGFDTEDWDFSDGFRPQVWLSDLVVNDLASTVTGLAGMNGGKGYGLPVYDMTYGGASASSDSKPPAPAAAGQASSAPVGGSVVPPMPAAAGLTSVSDIQDASEDLFEAAKDATYAHMTVPLVGDDDSSAETRLKAFAKVHADHVSALDYAKKQGNQAEVDRLSSLLTELPIREKLARDAFDAMKNKVVEIKNLNDAIQQAPDSATKSAQDLYVTQAAAYAQLAEMRQSVEDQVVGAQMGTPLPADLISASVRGRATTLDAAKKLAEEHKVAAAALATIAQKHYDSLNTLYKGLDKKIQDAKDAGDEKKAEKLQKLKDDPSTKKLLDDAKAAVDGVKGHSADIDGLTTRILAITDPAMLGVAQIGLTDQEEIIATAKGIDTVLGKSVTTFEDAIEKGRTSVVVAPVATAGGQQSGGQPGQQSGGQQGQQSMQQPVDPLAAERNIGLALYNSHDKRVADSVARVNEIAEHIKEIQDFQLRIQDPTYLDATVQDLIAKRDQARVGLQALVEMRGGADGKGPNPLADLHTALKDAKTPEEVKEATEALRTFINGDSLRAYEQVKTAHESVAQTVKTGEIGKKLDQIRREGNWDKVRGYDGGNGALSDLVGKPGEGPGLATRGFNAVSGMVSNTLDWFRNDLFWASKNAGKDGESLYKWGYVAAMGLGGWWALNLVQKLTGMGGGLKMLIGAAIVAWAVSKTGEIGDRFDRVRGMNDRWDTQGWSKNALNMPMGGERKVELIGADGKPKTVTITDSGKSDPNAARQQPHAGGMPESGKVINLAEERAKREAAKAEVVVQQGASEEDKKEAVLQGIAGNLPKDMTSGGTYTACRTVVETAAKAGEVVCVNFSVDKPDPNGPTELRMVSGGN